MGKPFAKLFDTAHGQLLVFRDYDSQDDQDQLVTIGAAVCGVIPRINAGYDNPEAADAAFDKFDQAMADKGAKSMHNLVAGLAKQEPVNG